MSGVTDSHKTAASVQSEKSVESAEPAEIVAVTQGETERRMSDLSAPAGASSHGKGRLSARGNWHTRLRVGIMGGTFDPIHNGHLVAASEVAWVYDLDEVIFVPTGRPVFKLDKHVTNAEDRYLMTVIATASNPKFTVSRVDIDRPGVTYTIDTLRDIRAQHPDAELFFITGADAVAEIMQWKDADLMWDLAHFVAVTRPGYSSPDGVTLPEERSIRLRSRPWPSLRPMYAAAPNTTSRSGIWCLTAWCNTSASMVCIHTRTDDSYED